MIQKGETVLIDNYSLENANTDGSDRFHQMQFHLPLDKLSEG